MAWPTEPCTTGNSDRAAAFVIAPGTELLGKDRSGGFREQRYLVRRGDGQVAQLPQVLYLVTAATDGRHDHAAVAEYVRDNLGQSISIEQIDFLIRHRLLPAGILTTTRATDTHSSTTTQPTHERTEAPQSISSPPPQPQRADHLLTLRHRRAVVPATAVRIIAGVFQGLYRPTAVVAGLTAFLGVDALLLDRLSALRLLTSAQQLVTAPATTLLVIVLVISAGVFHECGHVAACRYSRATPGAMGVGIYLVWPAFYSDVTDAYRLGRAGRLRTDLGGIYFNALTLTAIGAAYLVTDAPWLLAAAAVLHIDTAWQFLPSLRFDGYYILADLVGVPDLFNRLGPILGSLLPNSENPIGVTELKPWVRRVVRAWVLVVIPFLAGALFLLLMTLLHLLPAAGNMLSQLLGDAHHALQHGRVPAGIVTVGRAAMLLLPLFGGTLVVANLTRGLVRNGIARLSQQRVARAARASCSARSGHLLLAGGCVALLAPLAITTRADIAVLLGSVVLAALLTVVMLLRTPVVIPALIVALTAGSAAALHEIGRIPTTSLLIIAAQAISLCGLAVRVRTAREWPLLGVLPPFVIGLGLPIAPLGSVLSAIVAALTATRTPIRTNLPRHTGGRHRRSRRTPGTQHPAQNDSTPTGKDHHAALYQAT